MVLAKHVTIIIQRLAKTVYFQIAKSMKKLVRKESVRLAQKEKLLLVMSSSTHALDNNVKLVKLYLRTPNVPNVLNIPELMMQLKNVFQTLVLPDKSSLLMVNVKNVQLDLEQTKKIKNVFHQHVITKRMNI